MEYAATLLIIDSESAADPCRKWREAAFGARDCKEDQDGAASH